MGSIYSQDIKVLKLEIECKDIAIRELKKKLEIAQKEKDRIQFNVDKFKNASKSLNKLIESQIFDNCKKGLGYNAVPPPYIRNFMPLTLDLSFTGLYEFVNSLKIVKLSIAKIEIVKKLVSQLELLGEMISQEDVNQKLLGSLSSEWNTHAVVWRNKVELETMSMDDLYNNLKVYEPEVKGMSSSSSSTQNMAFVSSLNNNSGSSNEVVNTAQTVNTAYEVFTASTQVNTANSSNVDNLSDAVIYAFLASELNSLQLVTKDLQQIHPVDIEEMDLRCNENISFDKSKVECYNCHKKEHFARESRAPRNQDYKNKESTRWNIPVETSTSTAMVSCNGLGGHMTRNMSYLIDYEEIDGGYVAFGGNPKGGKIIGKGTIKTGNLDFENVYFMRELKFNLFSISQICDKKNNVLFNDTECIVLSPNFKLIDESEVLLRVPRKNNMYSVDLKNIVPKRGLTCLFAKATSDESKLWHRRLVDHKVKVIRCDNGTEFKNKEMSQFCKMKGILRQYSVAKTPQQNDVAERRNWTLIEAARTMLADSKLPTTFWAEAVNTACYVQNRVLVVKPHNKTPYELFHGRTPTLSFMRPFGCPVTIFNTIDYLGKFDGKADEGFFVGYSLNSSGPDWLFDINALTRTMNYKTIVTGTQSNGFAGTKASDNASQARKEIEPVKNYILLPLWHADPPFSQDPKSSQDDGSKPSSDDEKKVDEDPRKDSESIDQEKDDNVNSTNNVNAASTNEVNVVSGKTSIELLDDPNMPALEDYSIFDFTRNDEDDGVEDDINNLDTTIQVSPKPTIRIHKDHLLDQVIGDLQSATQAINMSKNLKEHGFVSTI
ncbi:ribonuclease H-like domain-containing protein [Tanacetum coccineum]|uniref:Ribonuclease H-like domain-containing protein n=1 Tax=Tanacetum coccineum TaxID=301880 RepID=A0ABQ5HM02_9ASTR